jgi:hypothetical protein
MEFGMKYFGSELSAAHKELGKIIRKIDRYDDSIKLFLDLHGKLHISEVSGGELNEADKLFNDITPHECRIMLTVKDETIAWALWHIARIEDLTMGMLVGRNGQLFDQNWKNKMNASISDTGNALSDDEIMDFSKKINIAKLLVYRNAVGKRTREIVKGLLPGDMARLISTDDIDKIRLEGGVTGHEDSKWLLDYWGKKDVAGLLLMPPTRHLIMHLNDICKWKQQIRAGHKYFRVD